LVCGQRGVPDGNASADRCPGNGIPALTGMDGRYFGGMAAAMGGGQSTGAFRRAGVAITGRTSVGPVNAVEMDVGTGIDAVARSTHGSGRPQEQRRQSVRQLRRCRGAKGTCELVSREVFIRLA
jgi:hypothetical protein